MIAFLDLKRLNALQVGGDAAISRVLDSGWYVLVQQLRHSRRVCCIHAKSNTA